MVCDELTDVFTQWTHRYKLRKNMGDGVGYNMFLNISLERQQKGEMTESFPQ